MAFGGNNSFPRLQGVAAGSSSRYPDNGGARAVADANDFMQANNFPAAETEQ